MGGNGDDIASCLWVPLAELPTAGLTDSDTEAVRRLRERGSL
jgi:hypothetical protein